MTTVYQVANARIVKDLVFGWSIEVNDSGFIPLTDLDLSYLLQLSMIGWAPIIPAEFKQAILDQMQELTKMDSVPEILKATKASPMPSEVPFDRMAYPTKEQAYGPLLLLVTAALEQYGKIDLAYCTIALDENKTCTLTINNDVSTHESIAICIDEIARKFW